MFKVRAVVVCYYNAIPMPVKSLASQNRQYLGGLPHTHHSPHLIGDVITGVGTAHSQRRFIDQIQTTHQDKDELLNDNEALNGMIYSIPIQTAIDSY